MTTTIFEITERSSSSNKTINTKQLQEVAYVH